MERLKHAWRCIWFFAFLLALILPAMCILVAKGPQAAMQGYLEMMFESGFGDSPLH